MRRAPPDFPPCLGIQNSLIAQQCGVPRQQFLNRRGSRLGCADMQDNPFRGHG
jgi:hypothetical protein